MGLVDPRGRNLTNFNALLDFNWTNFNFWSDFNWTNFNFFVVVPLVNFTVCGGNNNSLLFFGGGVWFNGWGVIGLRGCFGCKVVFSSLDGAGPFGRNCGGSEGP